MTRLHPLLALSLLALPACDSSAGGADDGPDAGSTACAAAPRAVVDTAQTGCYAATGATACPAANAAFYGQDAQHDGPAPRYTVAADGLTVYDERTGLTWQRSPDTTDDGVIDASDKLTWAQARARPAALAAARFGGYDDWRLPSIEELYSLIEFSGTDPSGLVGDDTSALTPFLDPSAFAFAYGDTAAGERVIDAQYASDTLYVSHTGNDGGGTLFGVNFADGRIKGYGLILNGADKTFFVIAVRGATGYGANALVDEGDGTVTDRATGLQWAQADSGAGMDWEAALAWAAARNAEGYLGHDDWRLPDAKELQGLVDYTRSPDTTGSAAIDPVFESTAITNEAGADDYPYYWTSTTHAAFDGTGGSAVYVAFGRAMGYMNGSWIDVHGAGAQRSDPKAGNPADYPTGHGPQGDAIRIDNYVRLVRDACLPADAAPAAAFTWSSASPAPADPVRFADASTGAPTAWAWTFTDDGATSADPAPVHAFALAGTYDVTLTVTGAGGSSTTTRRVTVQTGSAGGGGGGPVSCTAPADCEAAGACPPDAAQGCGCETTPDGQRCLPRCSAPSDCPSVDVPLTCGPQGYCVPA